jgi:hypothetical protein
MGRRKVWQAEFLAKNPHLRPVEQREQEAQAGPGRASRLCVECGVNPVLLGGDECADCADNGSYDRKPGQT